MTNIDRAGFVLAQLVRGGVREIVLCAGARNAPFVTLLAEARGLKTYAFFEERSAGFFAIGRMQSEGLPVAVCTTSGTAVAELLPAVVEADYQGLPLIVLSADRPVSYRGSGSPQSILQPGIFSHYVERTWDLEDVSDFVFEAGRRPVHINICFDEPLLDGNGKGAVYPAPRTLSVRPTATNENLINFTTSVTEPVVIVGRLNQLESVSVRRVLFQWQRPVYLEALSQLRGTPELKALELIGGEDSIKSLDIDGVIRVGDVPTLRFWRDLEKSDLPVTHFSRRPWSGLPRQKKVFDFEAMAQLNHRFTPWPINESQRDQQRAQRLRDLLAEFPLSECAWLHRLSQWIPPHARVFLGNSLPIREWDLAAVRDKVWSIVANRGTNGIDGLISTFLGVAGDNTPNWAVIGDLSALYDLSGPWALRQRPVKDINLVVINNGGGKIFERIFHNKLFENSHDLEFEGWAKMWRWNYQKLTTLSDQPGLDQHGPRLFEIVPDPNHSEAFNNLWEPRQ